MPGSQEFEFKFEVVDRRESSGERPSLETTVASATPKTLEAIYYETPGGDLRKSRLMLRVRGDGTRYIMTLKSDGATPFERGEWEREVPGKEPDLALLADTPHADVLSRIDARDLLPRLGTEIVRRSTVVTHQRTKIEVTYDEGEIHARERRLAVREYEFELVSGRRDEMFRFVRSLPRDGSLRLGLVSKGERGFLLADGKWGMPVKGAPVTLTADMSAASAFAAIVHACLHQFALNQPAFANGEEVEAVHQSRVALRRLRAAMSIFKMIIQDRELDRLRGEIAWIGELLGRARDLDVLQTETVRPVLEKEPDAAGFRALHDSIEAERLQAHAALKEALATPRLADLILDLTLWVEDGPWRRARTSEIMDLRNGPVCDYARLELDRRANKFAGKAKRLEQLTPLQQHDERIRAKKLRYGAQFFESLASGHKQERQARRFIRSMEEVQTALGLIQDAETRSAFLTKLAQGWASRSSGDAAMLLFAAGRIAALEPDREDLIERAGKAARKAVEAKYFWSSF